ncbi:MAG: PKD domain-containing protein [Planctomycetes bacterium]|nr:PKD domain-containing protein [Planctomycetota bacterium]
MKTLAFLLAFSGAAAAQVTGGVRYQDRTYDGSGFTGLAMRPVRQAEIEIVRSSDSALLASGATDDTGSFSLAVPPGEVVRLRIYARRAGGKINAVIRNNAVAGLIYAAATPPLDTSVTTSFGMVDLLISGGGAPAFNLFDCAVKTFQYLASIEPALPAVPPLLQIYWEAGSANGTYFEKTVNSLFLLGLSSDPDEYDDDIVLHEIGHWIAHNFSKDDTLGGPHTVIDPLDPRTSWSEGWAHYWSAVVRRFFPGEYSAPHLQVDNFGVGHSTFDLAAPSFPAQAVMATNELAVGCVLWNVTGVVGTPTIEEGEIWRSLSVRIPPRTNITLEDFHAGLALEAPAIMTAVTGTAALPGIFKSRLIRYYADGSEPNNSPGAPTSLPLGLAGLALQTLYAAGDEDWYSIAAAPGTLVVETLNLGDGADTLLQLYDAAGTTLLAANDNRSPLDPSSQITRVVSAPTTFLVRVLASGSLIEHGYYDLRAQVVVNGPPAIAAISASATAGSAPLRVTFSAAVVDIDGGSHEYQWDFDGDGIVDWSSFDGATVTTTYDEPGTFIARLRVVDSGDSTVSAPVTVVVLGPSPASVTFPPPPPLGPTPASLNFDAAVAGVIPTAYLWDFDGNGIYDSVSVTTAAAPFTFRSPGTYFPRLLVRDSRGVATRALAPALTIAVGPLPPTIGSFTAGGGILPFASTMTVAHSDLGPTGTVEFDVDGDGRYDFIVAPGSATGTTFSPEIQRAGDFTPRVRVTDSAGRSSSSTAAFTSRSIGVTGWMVDPRAGDRLSRTSITLTAQSVPSGVAKAVQFQYRDALGGGPWNNIGAPITSTGTLFSTAWNVTGLPDLTSFNLRILMDGTVSSGDTANTVMIDSILPTTTESGAIRTTMTRTDRTVVSRNAQGVWAIVPSGSVAAVLPLGLQPAAAPAANGSATGMRARGGAWRLSFPGTFQNSFRLRIPFTGDGTNLEIHHHDAASGVWQRLAFARVSHDDRWVEAEVAAEGVYALFESRGAGGGGGGRCGATGLEFLLLALLLRRRR